MGEKNKTCVTKTLFTNFTRRNCFLQVWKNLFIVLKIRSHAKLTCIFVNCDENKKIFACCFSLRLFSRSLLSVYIAILTFYIYTTQPSLPRRRFQGSSFSSLPTKRAPLKTPAWEVKLNPVLQKKDNARPAVVRSPQSPYLKLPNISNIYRVFCNYFRQH